MRVPDRSKSSLLLLLILFTASAFQPGTHAAARLRLEGESDEEFTTEVKATVYNTVSVYEERDFKRLGSPKPGDWLHFYKETPQTLERYKLATRIRPTAERNVIVLQPLGEMDAEKKKILEAMRNYAEIFFQTPARIEPPLPLTVPEGKQGFIRMLPAGNRHGVYDRQYNGDTIMTEILKKHLPSDAIVSLGITMSDLYSGDMNFVFGVGSLDERVGVYSLCRYFPEFWGVERNRGDNVQALRRACKVLNHEMGHMFGLTHCVFYRCSMNGSNSLEETDGAPIHFCPICHRKLMWNLNFDPEKRFTQLEQFYRSHDLTEEADWMLNRMKNYKKATDAEAARKDKGE